MENDVLQVNFRMPAEVKQRLEAAAEESGRSLTAEVVARLEESFRRLEFMEALRQQELRMVEKLAEGANALALAQSELNILRDALKTQQQSGETLAVASEMMARMIRRCIELLPNEIRKAHPEVRVWEASADAVIHGNARLLMEALGQLNRGDQAAEKQPPARKKPAAKKR